MSYPGAGVGVAAPRFVHSCNIENKSSNNVNVQIVYRKVEREGGLVEGVTSNFDIPASGNYQVAERVIECGSFQCRDTIESIEITRADGQTQKLTAPFDGVFSPQLDWLFVIDENQIHSVKKND
ncbi:unnamed protein product [Adineta steineri]|uniref:Uncharacterized protein n=1 Tax=Adineta steineri TaxID=433720 RepID=A0A819LMU5_9BILA|nr:unnamed protein product [Adineta steineri]CAF3966945.1 unnamed protein product [Adineta steineri]